MLHMKVLRCTESRASAQVPKGDECRAAQICVPLLLIGLLWFFAFKVKVTKITSLSKNLVPLSYPLLGLLVAS